MESSRRAKPGPRWPALAGLAATVGVLVGAATPTGAEVVALIQRLMDYYGGVFALVGLTLSVIAGLVATDRVILWIQHRILAQALHRAITLIALAALVAHIVMKILVRDATAVHVLLPVGRTNSIAVGTLAAQLMFVVAVTGAIRGRFAGRRRPGLWRAVHGLAYVAWLLALVHGLFAGRQPAVWVTWSYALSVVGVGVALVARCVLVVGTRNAEADTSAPRPRVTERTAERITEQRLKVPR